MLESIKSTLDESRCYFDVWFSERSLYEKNEDGTSAVDRALARLDEMGYLYRDEDGALWFRSTALGDDKDRVLIKTNGEYTYFASDVAYHWNKFQRVDPRDATSGAQTTTRLHPARRLRLGNSRYPASWKSFWPAREPAARRRADCACPKRRHHDPSKELMDARLVWTQPLYTHLQVEQPDDRLRHRRSRSRTTPTPSTTLPVRACAHLLDRAKGAGVTAEEAEARHGRGCQARGGRAVRCFRCSPTFAEQLARKLSEFPALVEGCARDRAFPSVLRTTPRPGGRLPSFYTVCQVLPPSKGAPSRRGPFQGSSRRRGRRRELALRSSCAGVHAPQEHVAFSPRPSFVLEAQRQ